MNDKNQTERVVRHIEAMGISRMAPSEISPGVIARMTTDLPVLKVVADLVKDATGTDPLRCIKLVKGLLWVMAFVAVIVAIAAVNMFFGLIGTDNEAKAILALSIVPVPVVLGLILFAAKTHVWRRFRNVLDVLSGGHFVNLVGYSDLTKVHSRATNLLTKAAIQVAQAEANHNDLESLSSANELTDKQDAFLKMYDALSIVPGLGFEEHYLNQARDDLKNKK